MLGGQGIPRLTCSCPVTYSESTSPCARSLSYTCHRPSILSTRLLSTAASSVVGSPSLLKLPTFGHYPHPSCQQSHSLPLPSSCQSGKHLKVRLICTAVLHCTYDWVEYNRLKGRLSRHKMHKISMVSLRGVNSRRHSLKQALVSSLIIAVANCPPCPPP